MSQVKTIEIPLQKILFTDDREVVLSFLAKEENKRSSACWVVSISGTTKNPITYHSSYDEALKEAQRACGTLSMGGKKMLTNSRYGEIRGEFKLNDLSKTPVIMKSGYRIKQTEPETDNKVKQTMKLK